MNPADIAPPIMSIPLWVLLLYVLWTIGIVLFALGGSRTYRVLKGEKFSNFPGGVAEGPPFAQRAMRAHLNCVENLPLYAAVALTAAVLGLDTAMLDWLAIAVILSRVLQSSVHLAVPQSERVVRVRGMLFGIQIVAIAWMAIYIATQAA